MNKIFIFIFIAAFILSACTSKPVSYTIEGVVPDESYNDQTVYMINHITREVIDKAVVTEKKFTFSGKTDSALICLLEIAPLYVEFILENGNIYVDMSSPESAQGTPLNDKRFKNAAEIAEKKQKEGAGIPFIDFTIENGDLDGSKGSLSDYVGKGKYVLVDFWASWCGPCIAEIPVLMEVYNKYKGDKFEILGVAVWDKRAETIKSLEKYKIPWPQIIDADKIPTDLYNIKGIPHIILFDPEGNIIQRELRGNKLKAKVAEVMEF